MQQAIYNNTITANAPQTNIKTPSVRKTTLRRHLAQKWDIYGVVALLASCTAYGVLVLGQVA